MHMYVCIHSGKFQSRNRIYRNYHCFLCYVYLFMCPDRMSALQTISQSLIFTDKFAAQTKNKQIPASKHRAVKTGEM